MEPHLTALTAIRTTRLCLKPLTVGDTPAFRAMTDDPRITEMVHFLHSPFTIEAAETLLLDNRNGADCFWGVWLKSAATLIGTVGTHLRDRHEIEIGYWFSPALHGRGYARESLSALLPMLLSHYPTRHIYAECRPENTPSWRLLAGVGFKATGLEGHRPGRSKLTYHHEGKNPDEP